MINQIVSTQFPANKNVTKKHDYWMKNRVKTLLTSIDRYQTFQDI